MRRFNIGDSVLVKTDAGWQLGIIDNRAEDTRGMLYVVSLERGGITYVRDAELKRKELSRAEVRVKALRAKYRS